MLVQRFEMHWCAITFVLGEAVVRILVVQFEHQSVARHFGDHTRGGDGEADAVAFDDGALGHREIRDSQAVD